MDKRRIPDGAPKYRGREGLISALLVEQLWPLVLSACASAGVLLLLNSAPVPNRLFEPVTAFASIMAGFSSTLLGIMFSIRDHGKVRILQKAGKFAFLKGYLYDAILSNMALVALGVAMICIDGGGPSSLAVVLTVAWSFFIFMSFFTCLRAVRLMYRLL